ncbi:hypothetical protein PoB_006780800 [Plakobranchus ocellatus]|uniref:Uncharacterized protein n=1 Tax=Plakobranchus ocellatus TaxID=259542 RepID=A0AAV4DB74_9GAST|nr:hypothetical protein PoB_006780800 [Plakobranchus ocellatus]
MVQLIPERHPLWLARKLDPKYGASSFMLNSNLFKVASQDIPKISQEPEKMVQLIPERHPLWLVRKLDPKYGASSFMLNSKLLWPLLVYKISNSTVESIEAKINKQVGKKWLIKDENEGITFLTKITW